MGPAQASEKACNREAIVTLADYVLTARTKALSRFQVRHFGSTALYLKITYGDMPEAEATDAVLEFFKAGVKDADQLASTYLLSRYGYRKASEMLGPEFAPKFFATTSNISLARAFLMSNDRGMFLDGLAKLDIRAGFQAAQDAVAAMLDQPDDVKLAIAREAEGKGVYELAGGMLLARQDRSEWRTFVTRLDSRYQVAFFEHAFPVITRLFDDEPASSGDGAAWNETLRAMHAADSKLFLSPILARVLNYTGGTGMLYAALRFEDAFAHNEQSYASERIDWARLDMFDALVVEMDGSRLLGALERTGSINGQAFRDNLRDELDWLLASAVAQQIIGDGPDRQPVPPISLSGEFSKTWPQWKETVDKIKSGEAFDPDAMEPFETAIYAEILFNSEMDSRLISLFETSQPSELMIRLANDFAIRLDRNCDGWLQRPGGNFLHTSIPLYRFGSK
ncbi:hypothetical protein AWJ14_15255 [Hoeflea olei]|uniref:Uncharacterized protein n=1 Tax=Hoeflea olei TaxID=1480615 RepID=A0A1C1YQP8_9HYPH|nr:hypothetical protein AWJ14_15255 [Hoeflea olei]